MRKPYDDILALLICIFFTVIGVWMTIEGKQIGWFTLLFFGVGGIFLVHSIYQEVTRERHKEKWLKQRKVDLAAIRESAGPFPYKDDVSFWKAFLAEAKLPWVVFENGTCVLCENKEDPEAEAIEKLKRYSGPGQEAKDFSVDIAADNTVWLVRYFCDSVLNYRAIDTQETETVAGLIARTIRDDDARALNIVHVNNG